MFATSLDFNTHLILRPALLSQDADQLRVASFLLSQSEDGKTSLWQSVRGLWSDLVVSARSPSFQCGYMSIVMGLAKDLPNSKRLWFPYKNVLVLFSKRVPIALNEAVSCQSISVISNLPCLFIIRYPSVREQALRSVASTGGGSWYAELEQLALGEC